VRHGRVLHLLIGRIPFLLVYGTPKLLTLPTAAVCLLSVPTVFVLQLVLCILQRGKLVILRLLCSFKKLHLVLHLTDLLLPLNTHYTVAGYASTTDRAAFRPDHPRNVEQIQPSRALQFKTHLVSLNRISEGDKIPNLSRVELPTTPSVHQILDLM